MVKERPAVLCGKAVIIEALVREPVQIKVQQRHETLLAVNNFITQLPFEPFNVIEDTDSEFSNVTTHEIESNSCSLSLSVQTYSR